MCTLTDGNLMRFVSALFIVLIAAAPLRAQAHTVEVRTMHGPDPVRAAVMLGPRQARANSRGITRFQAEPGTYLLSATAVGYEAAMLTLTVRSDTIVVIQLGEAVHEGEAIIVMSTRGERRVQDEPVKVEVVTQEEVEEKLMMTPGSIAMLLNETPGLRVQETSPALGGAVIRVQGLRGRYTQLLADGLPLHGGQTGSLGVLQIPPLDLAQVEVIKGAASALFGASAMGGAINLISRRPESATEVLLNATTRGGADVVLWQSDELSERAGYTFIGSAHGQRMQDIDDDDWADLPRYRRIVLRPRLFLHNEQGASAMITAGATLEDRRGGGTVPGGTQPQEIETRKWDAGVTLRRPLSSALHVDARGSYSAAAHAHTLGVQGLEDMHRTGFAEASLRGQHGRHYWVVGGALQVDAFEGRNFTFFDYTWWTPSLFVQDEIEVSERIAASLSLRADAHSEYGTFLAPRASALLRLSEPANLRITLGRGYSAPTAFTEETEEAGLRNVLPPSGLRAERITIASTDLNWNVSPFEANVSVFGANIDDAVEAVESGSLLELVNIPGQTRTRGVETLLRYRAEPFVVTTSYSYVRARREDGTRVPLVPEHSASAVAMMEDHERGRIGLELYYTGEQLLDDNPYRARSRPYVLVGVLVERRLGRARVFVNMENLTDVRQSKYDPLIRPAATRYGRWTTDVWAPVDGRTINAGVRVELR
jgi:outer membrane receptor for ferrienterochelin and colicins